MASYNRVVLVGNLTRDPEYKQLPSGQAVCRLGLAVNRSFKNKQSGTAIQEVCYIDIDVWGAQAESCNQYLKKGRPVLVEGRLKFDTWQDQQGGTRSKHSVVADRVVFLQSGVGAGAEIAEAGDDMAAMTPARPSTISAPLEKEIMDQIEAIKNRPKAAKTSVKKEENGSEGGVEFKDEPPFQDELPF
jgi:single-strand DNA-binding protein